MWREDGGGNGTRGRRGRKAERKRLRRTDGGRVI